MKKKTVNIRIYEKTNLKLDGKLLKLRKKGVKINKMEYIDLLVSES